MNTRKPDFPGIFQARKAEGLTVQGESLPPEQRVKKKRVKKADIAAETQSNQVPTGKGSPMLSDFAAEEPKNQIEFIDLDCADDGAD
jgi:hypothetical protein